MVGEKTNVKEQAKQLIEKLRAEGKPIIVDIGASIRRRGTVTLDLHPLPGVDLVWNVLDGLPFPDDSLDGIVIFHVIEHLPVEKFEFVFAEIWRCCKGGARVHVKTPHFSCGLSAWSDPTHIRPYGVATFREYLCGSVRMHFNSLFPKLPAFSAQSVSLRYYTFFEDREVRLRGIANAFDWLANLSPWVQRQFERRLAYLFGGFEEVDAVLTVLK